MADVSSFSTGFATTLATVATFAITFTYSSFKETCEKSNGICTLIVRVSMVLVNGLVCVAVVAVLSRPVSNFDKVFRGWLILSAVVITGFILLSVSIGLSPDTHTNPAWHGAYHRSLHHSMCLSSNYKRGIQTNNGIYQINGRDWNISLVKGQVGLDQVLPHI